MPVKLLPVPYYEQERNDYCGAACLQMVLQACGANLPGDGNGEIQTRLIDEVQQKEDRDSALNWASQPDGIEKVLEERLGRDDGALRVVAEAEEDVLVCAIAWSVFNDIPPIVATKKESHWVVVVGCDTNRIPAGPMDSDCHVRALDIHDPWRTESVGWDPPPPPPPKHVTVRTWKKDYLEPVVDGRWKGKVVTVASS